MNRFALIGVVAFLLIGPGLLAGSAYLGLAAWREHVRLVSHEAWPHVDGVRVSVSPGRAQDGDTFYRTETAWTVPDGHTYKHEGISNSLVVTGESVPLRYDPANPSYAEPPGGSVDLLPTLILGVMGLAFSGIAVRVLRDEWRASKTAV